MRLKDAIILAASFVLGMFGGIVGVFWWMWLVSRGIKC